MENLRMTVDPFLIAMLEDLQKRSDSQFNQIAERSDRLATREERIAFWLGYAAGVESATFPAGSPSMASVSESIISEGRKHAVS